MHKPLIAILLPSLLMIADACFAQTQTPAPRRADFFIPIRHKCLDLLELEKIKVNQETNTLTYDINAQGQLVADFHEVVGWFSGFFTAVNMFAQPDGNVTKGT